VANQPPLGTVPRVTWFCVQVNLGLHGYKLSFLLNDLPGSLEEWLEFKCHAFADCCSYSVGRRRAPDLHEFGRSS